MSQPRKSFTTPKGTELPLLNLKGKEYLQVAHRLVWFREEHPTGIIKTQMLALQGEGGAEYSVFKAEIYIGGVMVSSAHKKETFAGFPDHIEKGETGAVGRALAMAGFGTAFCGDELEEKDRLADAPLARVESAPEIVSSTSNGSAPKRASFRKPVAVPTAPVAGDDI
jgi:hypothetical protein